MKRTSKIAACLIALICALPIAAFAQTGVSSEAQEHILSQLRRACIPNAAVAVIQGGETSYILKDSERDTLFQIGSVAKSFTAFGVLLLEDMGLLSVSDPVNRHLPWFEARYRGVPVPHEDITIYNLLHNTSGITSDERRFPSIWLGTQDEFVAELAGTELAFYPSMGYAYGNANFVILGFLIEAVSGLSYDEFMTRHVLHPLGLRNTFASAQSAHATGRVIGGNRMGFFQPRTWNPPVSPIAIPTGFIYSSVADMARWAGIQLGAVEISEQLAMVARRSHEHNHATDATFAGRSYFYGGGWRVEWESGNIRHGGETPGYTATLIMRPSNNSAVVVLGNRHYGSTLQFGGMVLDAVDGVAFDEIGIDILAILDIAFAVLTAAGIVYIGLFARLAVRTARRLRNGGAIGASFTFKNMTGIFSPLVSLATLIGFYVGFPALNGNSLASLSLLAPASMATVIIALWIMAAHSWCAWLVKVFVKPQES